MSPFEPVTVDFMGGTSASGTPAYRRGSVARRLVDGITDGVRGVALCAALGTSAAPAAAKADDVVLSPQASGSTFATFGCAAVDGPEHDLATIRELSGLTWAQIAHIFDVDRRSVHLWAEGAGITARNVQNLAKVATRLRSLARRTGPTELRNRLLRPLVGGKCGLDRLLDDAGGVRAERTPSAIRKPPASAVAQYEAMRKLEPTLLDRLNSSYDAIPAADGNGPAEKSKGPQKT